MSSKCLLNVYKISIDGMYVWWKLLHAILNLIEKIKGDYVKKYILNNTFRTIGKVLSIHPGAYKWYEISKVRFEYSRNSW